MWMRRVAHQQFTRAFATNLTGLKKTPLFEVHAELGGKMVDFAGYAMPVQYRAGIVKSHNHTRTPGMASLFDVSHMGQLRVTGKDRVRFFESLVVGDLDALDDAGEAKLSLITNDNGGIIDDTVISRYPDHLYVVVNAGNQDIDWQHFQNHLLDFKGDVQLEKITDRALIALQGPGASEIMSEFVPQVNLKDLEFMHGVYTSLPSEQTDILLTRCGYTGEDGFEISIPATKAPGFFKKLISDERVLEAGLGARDSLRLEAGLCLHGHDITPETTPIEGTLAWTIGKRRREEGGFPGHARIMDQLKNKTFTKKRVGFVVEGPAAREGAQLYDAKGENVVGHVTSGTFSPILKKAIGMAYVDKAFAKNGTELCVKARNKVQAAKVSKMPFVPSNYYKKAA